jgi:hypothetical protein
MMNSLKSIQEQTDELFQRWKQQFSADGINGFCEDGLVYRGENWEDGKGKDLGNEEELWLNTPKRVVFLLKDTNDNADCDLREFNPNGKKVHYKNLAYWLVGFLSFDETNDAPEFDTIDFGNDVFPLFDKEPYAIVNCKKESGGSTSSTDVLQEHLNRYGNFVKEQIDILDPDIVVCGGGSSVIKNFVESVVYPDLEKINNWVYYDKAKDKVVIDSYHPSYWQIEGGSKTIYAAMMNAYKEFLCKYPHFRKSCRVRAK